MIGPRTLARVVLGCGVALITLTVGAAGAAGGAVTATADPAIVPTVAVDRTGTAAGETVLVSGRGWPSGGLVVVELCGNSGRVGTSDCDATHSQLVAAGEDGVIRTALTVGRPPVPCPCVIKATSQTSQDWATVPIAVQGQPTAEATPVVLRGVRRAIQIAEANVSGRGPWYSWLGGRAHRRLELTIRNVGDVTVQSATLAVAAGRGDDPQRIVRVQRVGSIEAGASRVVVVPFSLGSLAFGRYTARADVDGFEQPVTATAGTSAYPWVLLLAAAGGLQLLLLRGRDRLRARLLREPGTALAATTTEIDEEAVAVAAAASVEAARIRDAEDYLDIGAPSFVAAVDLRDVTPPPVIAVHQVTIPEIAMPQMTTPFAGGAAAAAADVDRFLEEAREIAASVRALGALCRAFVEVIDGEARAIVDEAAALQREFSTLADHTTTIDLTDDNSGRGR